MKSAFSILMITAMMLPHLTKIGILIAFKINQDYIAEVLCINREKPATMCSGKCYLSEQLKKAEEQEEKQTPTHKKEKVEVVYYFAKSASGFSNLSESYSCNLKFAFENEFYPSSFTTAIFQPPKLNLI